MPSRTLLLLLLVALGGCHGASTRAPGREGPDTDDTDPGEDTDTDASVDTLPCGPPAETSASSADHALSDAWPHGSADLTGDGIDELLAVSQSALGDGTVYLAQDPFATASLADVPDRVDLDASSVVFGVADGDDDGDDDLVLLTQLDDPGVRVWLLPGPVVGVVAASEAAIEIPVAQPRWVTAVLDSDGDGADDLFYWHLADRAELCRLSGPLAPVPAGVTCARNEIDDPSRSVATGDVDGDGLPDLVTGSPSWSSIEGESHTPDEGAAYVVLGGITDGLSFADADARLTGSVELEYAGWQVLAEDLDEDGRDEVLVGSPGYHHPNGAIWVVEDPTRWRVLGTATDLRVEGGPLGDRIGESFSVAPLGCEGSPALVVNAPQAAYGIYEQAGATWVLSPPEGNVDLGAVPPTFVGTTAQDFARLADADADLDGDGIVDVVLSTSQGSWLFSGAAWD